MRQGKISTRPNARWPGFAKLSMMLTVASIVLTALCLSGCASHRRSVSVSSLEDQWSSVRVDSVFRLAVDSASELLEIRTDPVTVPMSSVSLRIVTDSLRSLPAGASYSDRSGQASVSVTRRSATSTEPEYIYVYATCDSLQLQCERYERTIRSLRRNYGEELSRLESCVSSLSSASHELTVKPRGGLQISLKWFLYGLIGGFLLLRIKYIVSIIKKISRK